MVAVFDYDPRESSPNTDIEAELTFSAGDIIHVFGDMDEDGFFYGELNGHRGLVPSNFLQAFPEEPPPPEPDTCTSSSEPQDLVPSALEGALCLPAEPSIPYRKEPPDLQLEAAASPTPDLTPAPDPAAAEVRSSPLDTPAPSASAVQAKKKKGFFSKGPGISPPAAFLVVPKATRKLRGEGAAFIVLL